MTLIYFSCERTSPNSLRIISINAGKPLIVDIVYYVLEVDPETGDTILVEHLAPDQIVPIEVGYTEIGIGLPTYPTPYTARCTSYTVIFRRSDHPSPWRPINVNGGTNIVIQADPLKTVQVNLKVLPIEWMELYLDTLYEGVQLKATVILSGYEELTRSPVSDTGFFTIDIADYPIIPLVFGSK